VQAQAALSGFKNLSRLLGGRGKNSACLRSFGDLLADALFDARTDIVAIVHRCNGLFLNCLMMARLNRRSRAGDHTQRSLATMKIGTAEAETFTWHWCAGDLIDFGSKAPFHKCGGHFSFAPKSGGKADISISTRPASLTNAIDRIFILVLLRLAKDDSNRQLPAVRPVE
jgi:hypothetical protein